MENQKTPDLLPRLGDAEGIRRWMVRFYDLISAHPLLAPLFGDISSSREKQIAFMIEYFGGPDLYTRQFGKPFLRFKHRHLKIGQAERDAWMELLIGSLRELTPDETLIAEVHARIAHLADAMINHHPDKKDSYYFN